MKGICGKVGVNQGRYCVDQGEKYCAEIRSVCNRTSKHCYAPIFRQAALDALASKESSAEGRGGEGLHDTCDSPSTDDAATSDVLIETNRNLKTEVDELRSQLNRMEDAMGKILSLLS